MKKMMKKFIATFLVVAIVFCSAPLSGLVGLELPDWLDLSIKTLAAETSGTCGENLTWTLDTETGVLEISGTGDMTDYTSSSSVPWSSYRSSITSVTIGDSVISIGDHAFYYCTSLTSVTIPDSVTNIGSGAFSGCTSLTNITIPDSITSIGYSTFSNCTSLESVTIGDNVTSIGQSAFYNCTRLTNITIPDSVTSISSYAFEYCTSLTSVTIGDSVTSIGEAAFRDCTSLASITIGNSVTSIGGWAFSDCTSLTSITIPDSVISIGNGAFEYCTSLTSITIPDSVTSISYYAFYGCTSLTSIAIPDSVTSIGEAAFYHCTSLTSITIPDSVTSIGNYAFRYCTSLTSITIGNSVTSIGGWAFSDCTSLTSITIPDSVISIGNGAFEYCTSLTSITIPDSVTSIGYYAFADCTSITSITIPDSVTSIGNYEFRDCTSLTSISVVEDNQYYSNDEYGVLFNKDKTTLIQYPAGNTRTSYTISDSITSIGNGAFNYCTSLTSIIIPDSVTSIGYYAFYGCTGLTSITIPDSVTSIGNYAFFDCTSLTDVYYTGTEEQWNAITIKDYNESLTNATIHYNYSPEHTHTPKDVRIEPTCTVNGMEYTICEECGETIGDTTILPAGHVWGEWYVALEPTIYADGREERKCSRCNETESRVIPKLAETIKDDDSGIELVIPNEAYDEDIKLEIEEVYDGASFQIVDGLGNVSETKIFDITTTLNGVVVQPNTTLTVRIPLPAGYDPNRTFIYHVNSETGAVENMKARHEDGYLVFETNHFSHYAIVEMGEEYNYTFSIQTPSLTEIRCKDGIILHANLNGTYPEGTRIEWTSSNGNFDKSVVDGNSLKIISKDKGYTTFTATLYDADGNVLATDSAEMYSKAGFFDKIGGFFRNLFKTTTIYES